VKSNRRFGDERRLEPPSATRRRRPAAFARTSRRRLRVYAPASAARRRSALTVRIAEVEAEAGDERARRWAARLVDSRPTGCPSPAGPSAAPPRLGTGGSSATGWTRTAGRWGGRSTGRDPSEWTSVEVKTGRTRRRRRTRCAGSSWRHAPDVFGVTGKVGEQRGDGVRAAMVMVPAEVAPAAGAATPAVEPPPGAAR